MFGDVAVRSPRDRLWRTMARAAKLAFDLLAASTIILILSPLLLTVAFLIKLDGGPVFYSHRRVGAGGRVFSCLKFRSMVVEGEEILQRLLSMEPGIAAEWSATRKLRHDPRVTPIGRVLRSTSIDELPQLFNVLRGDMSLVGPRPIVSEEVPRYGLNIHYYYHMRPGITGLWQVSGRSETSYAERVELDTTYVKNWSLAQDGAILLRTIPEVMKRRGAV